MRLVPTLPALTLLPLLALTACVEPPPTAPSAPVDACNAAGYQGLVGQSSSVLRSMMLPAGSRVINPGDAITMDYQAERLNVEIGTDGRISKVGCY